MIGKVWAVVAVAVVVILGTYALKVHSDSVEAAKMEQAAKERQETDVVMKNLEKHSADLKAKLESESKANELRTQIDIAYIDAGETKEQRRQRHAQEAIIEQNERERAK